MEGWDLIHDEMYDGLGMDRLPKAIRQRDGTVLAISSERAGIFKIL